MPIRDIQPSIPSLTRLGVIRLGIKKQSKNGNEYPAEADHFVLRDAPDVIASYGTQPKTLLVYLPYPTVDQNMIAFHELWKAGGLYCRGDGATIQYLVDPNNSGEIVIRDGEVTQPYDEPDLGLTCAQGASIRCPGLEHGLYARCDKCKPMALLKVMVRDPHNPTRLVSDRLGYFQIRTSSILNIKDLTGQLMYIEELARWAGKDLRGIPLILQRVARTISYTDKGQKKQTEKWFVSLEVDPRWVAMASAGMESRAFGTPAPAAQLEALVTTAEELAQETVEGELVEDDAIGEMDDELAKVLADVRAARDAMPRGLHDAVLAIRDILGTAFDERGFFQHVRTHLGLNRTERFTYNAETWGAMIDVTCDMLVAKTDYEAAAD